MAVSGCRGSVAECCWLKPEALGSIPSSTTFLSLPLPFQKSSESNRSDCLRLDYHYWSSDCWGVLSIGLPMLWLRSPSIMIIFYGVNVKWVSMQPPFVFCDTMRRYISTCFCGKLYNGVIVKCVHTVVVADLSYIQANCDENQSCRRIMCM